MFVEPPFNNLAGHILKKFGKFYNERERTKS